ncbi:hypothetical protein Tco_0000459 [Tanacetum coccineum]
MDALRTQYLSARLIARHRSCRVSQKRTDGERMRPGVHSVSRDEERSRGRGGDALIGELKKCYSKLGRQALRISQEPYGGGWGVLNNDWQEIGDRRYYRVCVVGVVVGGGSLRGEGIGAADGDSDEGVMSDHARRGGCTAESSEDDVERRSLRCGYYRGAGSQNHEGVRARGYDVVVGVRGEWRRMERGVAEDRISSTGEPSQRTGSRGSGYSSHMIGKEIGLSTDLSRHDLLSYTEARSSSLWDKFGGDVISECWVIATIHSRWIQRLSTVSHDFDNSIGDVCDNLRFRRGAGPPVGVELQELATVNKKDSVMFREGERASGCAPS